ncbi:uncharacterized protein ALTATR162_LOCUS1580 [Alternaria atra]|uniref:BTB domain-containing protein n=1 Tax=Alternaria atra TaxID=119953 RepID=A0A8J2HVW3_9PLEO|nr:uncharacterized protein ALTATR162_LOCUS1580 [Alternaria atra]CAG5144639.1 unnamed protein product [Alternaria atra]
MWEPFGSPKHNATGEWRGGPNERGTFDILSTCLITLILCVWTALHLNIPDHGKTSVTHMAKRKTVWLVVGLFAPEFIVLLAFQQWLSAKQLQSEIAKIAERTRPRDKMTDREDMGPAAHVDKEEGNNTDSYSIEDDVSPRPLAEWTKIHAHYALMGGFAFSTHRSEINILPDDITRAVLTTQGLLHIIKYFPDLIPDISEEAIEDKSKASALAKTLVCLQATWFVVETIGRLATSYPISLLEMNTLVHALCCLAVYIAWWDKPLDIEESTLIPCDNTRTESLCARMVEKSGLGELHKPTELIVLPKFLADPLPGTFEGVLVKAAQDPDETTNGIEPPNSFEDSRRSVYAWLHIQGYESLFQLIMSELKFDLNKPLAQSPLPASVNKSSSDAQTKSRVRLVCENEMLVFDTALTNIRVGTGHHRIDFLVHKPLLTSRSEFIKRATSEEWYGKTFIADNVDLPDDDPNTVKLYLNLVYANQLVINGTGQWLKLCQLYVLAEKLQDTTSKNKIIDGMLVFYQELVKETPLSVNSKRMLPAAATVKLYEGTPDRSQARKLLLDLYSDFGDESWLRSEQTELPAEFICDVAVRLLQKRTCVIFGSKIMGPSSHYYEPSVSLPEKAGTVTGEINDASKDRQSDTVKVVKLAEENITEKDTNSKDIKPESKLGSSGAAASQVATPVAGNALPPLKGLATTVK